ncbi:hypothetical protein [Paraburkholderia solisilvae]|nr:hypothetical protein [Paraburkholderia solisilvae]
MDSPIAGQQIDFFVRLMRNPQSLHIRHAPAKARPEAAQMVRERLAALKTEMASSQLHTLIISAENLSNEHAYARLLAPEQAHFDVHIVAYIRRQDAYLSSSWGQWYVKAYESIDHYLGARMPIDADWHAALAGWTQEFGADRVRVRLFDRQRLHNGDVVDDFIQLVNLPVDASHQKVGAINESNDERMISLASRIREVFTSVHDTSPYDILNDVLAQSDHRPQKSKPYLFDLETRRRIMDTYAASNEKIKRTFFPDMPDDTPLFAPPAEDDVLNLSPLEKLDRDVSMLTKIVFALAKKSVQEGAQKVAVDTDAAAQVHRNPDTTRTLASVAVPKSKVLISALGSPWYLEQNPDVSRAGVDPYLHWRDFGATEGRLPAPDIAQLMIELLAERNAVSQNGRVN